jgi:hypothetical protein
MDVRLLRCDGLVDREQRVLAIAKSNYIFKSKSKYEVYVVPACAPRFEGGVVTTHFCVLLLGVLLIRFCVETVCLTSSALD